MVTTRSQQQHNEQQQSEKRPTLPTRSQFFNALPWLSTFDLPNHENSHCRLCNAPYCTAKPPLGVPEVPTRAACGHYFGRNCLIARHSRPNYSRLLRRERYTCTCSVPGCRAQLFSEPVKDGGEFVSVEREEIGFDMLAVPKAANAGAVELTGTLHMFRCNDAGMVGAVEASGPGREDWFDLDMSGVDVFDLEAFVERETSLLGATLRAALDEAMLRPHLDFAQVNDSEPSTFRGFETLNVDDDGVDMISLMYEN
jgi:hypothetical protein